MQFIRVDITTLPTKIMPAHTTLSELRDEIHRSRLDGQQFGIMRVLFSACYFEGYQTRL